MRKIEDVLREAHETWKIRVMTDSALHTRKAMRDVGPTMIKDFAAALFAEWQELWWECRGRVADTGNSLTITYHSKHQYASLGKKGTEGNVCLNCGAKREDVP